jgi:hypothetical protein
MNAKVFSLKVEGVVLTAQDEQLELSPGFDRKEVLPPHRRVSKRWLPYTNDMNRRTRSFAWGKGTAIAPFC